MENGNRQRTNTDKDWKSRRMDAKERNAIVSALVHLNTDTKQRANKESKKERETHVDSALDVQRLRNEFISDADRENYELCESSCVRL